MLWTLEEPEGVSTSGLFRLPRVWFKACFHAEAQVGRGDLTDAEWTIIGPLLPPERGRWGRPAQDNRRFLNAMPMYHTGIPV